MNSLPRRYFFMTYADLANAKIKKLSRVCSKAFVLVDSDLPSIPFPMVKKLQRLGNQIKWVVIDDATDAQFLTQMGFVIGTLHNRVSIDIEFAILSDDERFDDLVSLINSQKRSCQRVRTAAGNARDNHLDAAEQQQLSDVDAQGHQELPHQSPIEGFDQPVERPFQRERSAFVGTATQEAAAPKTDNHIIQLAAKETIRRMVNSGNRPGELDLLFDYILLHNEELTDQSTVHEVVLELESTDAIQIVENEVIYNF